MNKVDLIHISAIDLQPWQFLFDSGALPYVTQLYFMNMITLIIS